MNVNVNVNFASQVDSPAPMAGATFSRLTGSQQESGAVEVGVGVYVRLHLPLPKPLE